MCAVSPDNRDVSRCRAESSHRSVPSCHYFSGSEYKADVMGRLIEVKSLPDFSMPVAARGPDLSVGSAGVRRLKRDRERCQVNSVPQQRAENRGRIKEEGMRSGYGVFVTGELMALRSGRGREGWETEGRGTEGGSLISTQLKHRNNLLK